jgi:hypothetical protein
MMVLDAMALEACRLIHDKLHQHHRGNEGEDDGRWRRGRWPCIPGDVLVMVAEIQADLPLDHGIHEQPYKPCQDLLYISGDFRRLYPVGTNAKSMSCWTENTRRAERFGDWG